MKTLYIIEIIEDFVKKKRLLTELGIDSHKGHL